MSWQIDPNHSTIQFSARHMMITTVRGQFERFSGTVDADEQDPTHARVEIEIDATSLNSHNAQRDSDLRGPNFLDVEHYPTISFKSTRIEQIDDAHGRMTGDLTIHGETHDAVLDVEYTGQAKSPWGTTVAGFNAHTKLNRKNWGLTYNAILETGGVMVGEEITINIEVELVKQVDQAVGA